MRLLKKLLNQNNYETGIYWSDEDYLEEVKEEDDWITDNEKDYCSECYSYNDNDELIIDESRKDKYKE
jgi:hypothetical protein